MTMLAVTEVELSALSAAVVAVVGAVVALYKQIQHLRSSNPHPVALPTTVTVAPAAPVVSPPAAPPVV